MSPPMGNSSANEERTRVAKYISDEDSPRPFSLANQRINYDVDQRFRMRNATEEIPFAMKENKDLFFPEEIAAEIDCDENEYVVQLKVGSVPSLEDALPHTAPLRNSSGLTSGIQSEPRVQPAKKKSSKKQKRKRAARKTKNSKKLGLSLGHQTSIQQHARGHKLRSFAGGTGTDKTSGNNGCGKECIAPGPANAGLPVSSLHGGRAGGGGGGAGDGGDDENNKPEKKSDHHAKKASKQSKKIQKNNKGSSNGNLDSRTDATDVEMVSVAEELEVENQQPEQNPPNATKIKVPSELQWHANINRYNFCKCKNRSCESCNEVAEKIKDYFDEGNLDWATAVEYHWKVCLFKYRCEICTRVQPTFPKPAAAPVIVQQTPSLDPDEKVVWKDENIKNITHFKEKIHYMLEKKSFDKGRHGAIHNVEIFDEVKQDLFDSCRDFVVKKADKVEDDEKSVFEQTWKHPNLVKTYFVVQKMSPKLHHLIFMEKCERSLKDYLNELVKNGKTLEMYEAMFYWSQTLDGLKHLHHLRIPLLHKDIKAENVLLSVNNIMVRVKLADYDTAKRLHRKNTQRGLPPKGTAGLISPEVLRQEPHGCPSDIWNMAMFLFQVLFLVDFTKLQCTLKYSKSIDISLHIDRTEKLIQEFLDKKIPELKKLDNKLAELIQRCLHDDPLKRPTAIQILHDPAVVRYISMKINMDELIGKICPNRKT